MRMVPSLRRTRLTPLRFRHRPRPSAAAHVRHQLRRGTQKLLLETPPVLRPHVGDAPAGPRWPQSVCNDNGLGLARIAEFYPNHCGIGLAANNGVRALVVES